MELPQCAAATERAECTEKKRAMTANDLVQAAWFVFKGTVQRVNASLLSPVPASEQTYVVRVDEA